MPNIEGQKQWSPIRLLETHELARGGINGNLNEQAKALANRTEFLNQEKANKSEIVQGVFEFGTYAEFNAVKSNLPTNCSVVINEENTTGSGSWGIGNNRWNGIVLNKSAHQPATKDYVKNTGYASIVGVAVANINYTTSDRKLTFANTIWIETSTTNYPLTVPQSVDLPLNTPYRLQINTATKLISAVPFTDAVTEGNLILGFVTASSTTLKTIDFAFAVNNINQESLPLAKQYVGDTGYGRISPVADSNINFNSMTSILEFKNTIFVNTATTNYQLITPQNLTLSANGRYRIEINTTTKLLRAVPDTDPRIEGYVVFGYVKKTGTVLESDDFGKFTTDGVYVSPYVVKETQKVDFQSLQLTLNLNSKEFNLTSDSFAYTNGGKVLVKAGTATYGSVTGTYYALLNKSTSLIECYGSSAYLPLVNAGTHYYMFAFESATGKTYGYTGKLTVTGGAVVAGQAETNYSLALVEPDSVNFNFEQNKIEIKKLIWIRYGTSRIQVPIQEIPLDLARSTGYKHVLMVNPATSAISVISQVAPFSVPKDHIQIGAYQESNLTVWGLDYYSINGVSNIPPKKLRPCFSWDTQNPVDLNVSDSFTPSDTIHLGNLTSSIVYGWFDALMTQHPEYITRTFHGNDASGLYPIYSYRFKPLKPSLAASTVDTKIPKTMLITLHNEKINQVGLYILMREICNNWQSSEALTSMRHGMEFVVMPLVNPWGLNHGSRTNSRQVDINRNFPVGWQLLGVPGDATYSGQAALSEPEAQYAYQVIVDEKPDIYIDIHAYGQWNNEGRSIWIPTLNEKARVATTAAILKVYAQYKKKYPWVVDIDKFANVSNDAIVGGGISAKSGTFFGAVGGTFETAWNLKNEPTGLTGHSTAINLTADLIGTYILQCLAVIMDSD